MTELTPIQRIKRTALQVVIAGTLAVGGSVVAAISTADRLTAVDWTTTLDVAGLAGLLAILTTATAALMNRPSTP